MHNQIRHGDSETKKEALVITNKKSITINKTLKGKQLKQMNEFKYLGSIITNKNDSIADFGVFGKLDKIWKNKNSEQK